uniref:Tetratricopeptide repeat protein 39C n=1 Tax=Phallusia mammillata TaxID=59560 RepID=A0A6F9DWE6_9ASCI|nr:tetratricopeptide repeat protein 39C [Phallusia mammillata]
MANGTPQIQLPPGFDDHTLALEGVTLILNNGFNEAEVLFNKFSESSPLMSAGASFVCFMRGLMSFEEEKLEKAVVALKSTQKLCNSAEEDLIDAFKKKFKKKGPEKTPLTKVEILQRRVIVADCYLYVALIHFIKQDLTSYIKGGWNLRKAWKIYEKCHQQIREMLESRHLDCLAPTSVGFVNNGSAGNGHLTTEDLKLSGSSSSLNSSDTEEKSDIFDELAGDLKAFTVEDMKSGPDDMLLRLYGAVCFGYGAFNLCVSLVPQNLLRLVNMMGFCGDRDIGVKSLEVACGSRDMKAPMAMLCLLWYHTVVRPFFAVDGNSSDAGLPEAEQLLKENEVKYPKSSLVLFFKGRVLRCKCNIVEALTALQESYNQAADQRELQLLCAYEIGWCCIMQLDWERALTNITRLKEESKWSVCYYAYLTGLLHGVVGRMKECQEIMGEVPKLLKRKNNQLEAYVVRKAKVFQKIPPTQDHVTLLIFEIVYLWRAFPNCEKASLGKMMAECQAVTNPCLNGLKLLLMGSIHKTLGDVTKAMNCFQQAIQVTERDMEDGHFAPFACYELATTLIESTDCRARGLELLKHCKENFAGYDFENRLQMRIHATELRIKQEENNQ